MTGVVLRFPGISDLATPSKPDRMDDCNVLARAVYALIELAVATGKEPDWDLFVALCRMAGRFPTESQANSSLNGPAAPAADDAGQFDLELLWRRSLRGLPPSHSLLRDVFSDALRRLDRHEGARPADVEYFDSVIRWLQTNRDVMVGAAPLGGAH